MLRTWHQIVWANGRPCGARFPRIARGAVVLSTIVVTFVFSYHAPTANADDIVVGMSAAFTGASRGLSIELYRGSVAYFDSVNEAGGIQGRKLRILPYDDGYNPTPAIENTIKLIEQDNVFLLFDYMGSPTTTRVLPLLKMFHDNHHEVCLFFPFTGAQPSRQQPYNRFVFNLRASYHQETAALVDHFVEIGRRRIAVFYQVDAYGRAGWDGVRQTLANYDEQGSRIGHRVDSGREPLRMVAEASYRRGTNYREGMRAQVELLRAGKPDAIISVGTYEACAALIREVRNTGWDVPIANVSGVDSENLLKLLLEAGGSSGRDYTTNLINSQVVPSYHDMSLPAVIEYRALMDRLKPTPPKHLLDQPYDAPPYSYISFEGYLNAKLLTRILEKMGTELKQSRVRDVTEALGEVDLGIDVPASLSPHRHQGLDKVYCTTVLNGRFVPLSDEDWQRWKP
ncbi:MAG: ABC transporter substrate-binding protein [Planctomycetes bacterium]|nr:ABC transporter substrate-binding protein [Planctomycetota bacterium]